MKKTRRWKRRHRARRDRTRERVERRQAAESAARSERANEYFAKALGISVEKLRSRWRRQEIGMRLVP